MTFQFENIVRRCILRQAMFRIKYYFSNVLNCFIHQLNLDFILNLMLVLCVSLLLILLDFVDYNSFRLTHENVVELQLLSSNNVLRDNQPYSL